MKIRCLTYLGLAVLLQMVPALSAATISASASVLQSGALYDYSYQFTVSGTGAGVNAFFLSTSDLSPLNLTFNNSAWTWADGSGSTSGIELYNPTGSLAPGSSLGVTFASALAPQLSNFAVGLDTNGVLTNQVNGLAAPTATPEPGTLPMLFVGLFAAVGLTALRRCKAV